MGEVKQINIKNWTYYLYNDMINLKQNWAKLVKNWQKIIQKHWYYNIGYVTIKNIDEYESIYSANPLYLRVNHANRYIEEKNGNKYLILDSTDEIKELTKKLLRCLEWNQKQNQC